MSAVYAWALVVFLGGIMAGVGAGSSDWWLVVCGNLLSLVGFACLRKFGELPDD